MKVDPPIPLRPMHAVTASEAGDASSEDMVFRFLTETSGAAMAWVDPRRRRVTGANHAFAALLGYRPDAVLELPIEAFADSFPRAIEGRLVVTTGVDGRVSWDSRWRRRDGRSIDVTVAALELTRMGAVELLVVARPRDDRSHQRATLEVARHLPPGSLTGALWLDPQGRVAWADGLAAIVLRRPGDELVGAPISALAPELDEATWAEHWVTAVDNHGATLEATCITADGSELPCEITSRAVELDGTTYLCAFVNDTSEREVARRQFLDAEERYALAAMGANDGLWDWDLTRNSLVYSPRWAALIGCAEEQLHQTPATWLDRIHPDDRPRVDIELAGHLDGHTPHFESEHRLQHRDGTYRWVLFRGLAIRDAANRPVRMAGSTSDITHRKNAEARLRFEAFHDPLTGLANRALFIRRVHQTLEAVSPDSADAAFAVVVVDIDDFKLVNDSLGHTLGDMLLRAIASRLKRCVRAVDTVARLGGDEFCLLLEHVSDADVLRVADRVQEEMGVPFNLRGYEIYTSASVGVAYGREGYQEAEELLRDANIAMFRAKSGGRGRRAIFDASMRRAAVNRLTLETDLRRAVERGEFMLYYQPVIALDSGAVTGFEALIRWNHPKRGLVMPGDFIPLAEETGLIVPLGRWVLVTACEEAVRWEKLGLGPLQISVNVSARQLALPYLVEQVAQVVEQTGLAPERLNLEITESVLMDQAESVVAKLRELRRLGVGLHIDDFGTGYSSLAYLHRFPCDTLKIDKSFLLSHPTPDEDPWAIIGTIRSLAQLLGMAVTAEGVEQPEHLERLREIGCEHAQGFYMSRPVPADRIPALVTSNKRW